MKKPRKNSGLFCFLRKSNNDKLSSNVPEKSKSLMVDLDSRNPIHLLSHFLDAHDLHFS